MFASCGQEGFFEGHVHACRVLGGIPRRRIRYDNLRAAVERVLGFPRARVESDRWTAFRSHWGVEAFYCRPGIEGAHEKGGVEGQIGYFGATTSSRCPRSARWPSSMPWSTPRTWRTKPGVCVRAPARSVSTSPRNSRLQPLPAEVFETGRWFTQRVKELHGSPALRGHRRPAHLQRRHHPDRHRVLPPRSHQGAGRAGRGRLNRPAGAPARETGRPDGRFPITVHHQRMWLRTEPPPSPAVRWRCGCRRPERACSSASRRCRPPSWAE